MDTRRIQEQLILDEGLRLKPYKDASGKTTIGVGRNLDDRGITTEEAMTMLQNDIHQTILSLSKCKLWQVIKDDDARSRAIVNMAFNLGVGGLLRFRNTISDIESANWESAAQRLEQSDWASQVGERARRIIHVIRTGRDP